MKHLALTACGLVLSTVIAGTASAQVTATGPVGSLPPGLQTLVGGAGGVTAGTIVAATLLGTLLIVTVINDDGSTTTTTTTVPN